MSAIAEKPLLALPELRRDPVLAARVERVARIVRDDAAWVAALRRMARIQRLHSVRAPNAPFHWSEGPRPLD